MADVELFGESKEPVVIGFKTGSRTVNPNVAEQWSYQMTAAEAGSYRLNEEIQLFSGDQVGSVGFPLPNIPQSIVGPSETLRDGDFYTLDVGFYYENNESQDLKYSFDFGYSWMSLDPDTGVITGNVRPADDSTVRVRVSDEFNQTGTFSLNYTILGAFNALDIQHGLDTQVITNLTNGIVAELDTTQDYKVKIELQDNNGNYAGDINDPQTFPMIVNIGSVSFVERTGNTNQNEYRYSPPSSNAVKRPVVFSVGRYQDAEKTDLRQIQFGLDLIVSKENTFPYIDTSNIPTGGLMPGQYTMRVIFPDGNTRWRIDHFVNDDDQGNSNVQPDTDYIVTIPSGSSTAELMIVFWMDGETPPTLEERQEGVNTYTITVAVNNSVGGGIDRTGMTSFALTPVARPNFDDGDWNTFWQSGNCSRFFDDNPQKIAVKTVNGELALEVEHTPNGSNGTVRVNSAGILPVRAKKITIVQRIYLPNNYDFATDGAATQKCFFGARSLKDSSGGLQNPEGFSSRFQWRRKNGRIFWGLYVYEGNTAGFGDDYLSPIEVATGQWVELAQEVVMNTAYGTANGTAKMWVNGVQQPMTLNGNAAGTGINWINTRASGEPIEPSIYAIGVNSFHGGSGSTTFAPANTQFPAYNSFAYRSEQ